MASSAMTAETFDWSVSHPNRISQNTLGFVVLGESVCEFCMNHIRSLTVVNSEGCK